MRKSFSCSLCSQGRNRSFSWLNVFSFSQTKTLDDNGTWRASCVWIFFEDSVWKNSNIWNKKGKTGLQKPFFYLFIKGFRKFAIKTKAMISFKSDRQNRFVIKFCFEDKSIQKKRHQCWMLVRMQFLICNFNRNVLCYFIIIFLIFFSDRSYIVF